MQPATKGICRGSYNNIAQLGTNEVIQIDQDREENPAADGSIEVRSVL